MKCRVSPGNVWSINGPSKTFTASVLRGACRGATTRASPTTTTTETASSFARTTEHFHVQMWAEDEAAHFDGRRHGVDRIGAAPDAQVVVLLENFGERCAAIGKRLLNDVHHVRLVGSRVRRVRHDRAIAVGG